MLLRLPTVLSRAFFSRPRSWARLGSFQSVGSSSAALTSVRRPNLASKSKIPPQVFAAGLQVRKLGFEGVEKFGFHGRFSAIRKTLDYTPR
jgi:hypothetical protein